MRSDGIVHFSVPRIGRELGAAKVAVPKVINRYGKAHRLGL
jgi:hypothetical protein